MLKKFRTKNKILAQSMKIKNNNNHIVLGFYLIIIKSQL